MVSVSSSLLPLGVSLLPTTSFGTLGCRVRQTGDDDAPILLPKSIVVTPLSLLRISQHLLLPSPAAIQYFQPVSDSATVQSGDGGLGCLISVSRSSVLNSQDPICTFSVAPLVSYSLGIL